MTTSDRIEAFKRLLVGSAETYFKDVQESEITEMTDEFEGELTESFLLPDLPSDKHLPADDEIVAWELDGSPLSRFSDDKWVFKQLARETVVINFGKNHPGLVDLSHPFAEPLRRLEKLIAYYSHPGNAFVRGTSPKSTIKMVQRFRHLLGYFYNNGYLLAINDNCKTLQTIDVDLLKSEVRARISQAMSKQSTVYFAHAISHWIFLTKMRALPDEFGAPFSAHDFWQGGLSREVARYEAEVTGSWQAIDFDDLVPLISTSSQYIQDFASDLLFLQSKYLDAHDLKGRGTSHLMSEGGSTKEIYNEIMNHKFPAEIKNELLKVKTNARRSRCLYVQSWIKHWRILASAAIFRLLLWTAERKNDLRIHKVSDLIVDGKPLDFNKNAVDQVQLGNRFDLWRTETKTSPDPRGTRHLIPLPKDGALAFAVLVELYRRYRTQTGNSYLLPGGYAFFSATHRKSHSEPCSSKQVETIFGEIRDFIGIDRLHPHQCRKTLATLLINHNPRALELIRDLLCHKSVVMTMMYLMSLPGVAEDVQNQMLNSQFDKVAKYIAYGADGKLAGAAGNETLNVVKANPDFFKASAIASTVNEVLESITGDGNLRIVRTPAAWCLRFPSRVPWTAPCLPPNSLDEPVLPNPEKCRPWECRHAAHTPDDIKTVKSALAWSKKAASESKSLKAKASYSQQAAYWQEVLFQLENGRADIVSLHIIDQVLRVAGKK